MKTIKIIINAEYINYLQGYKQQVPQEINFGNMKNMRNMRNMLNIQFEKQYTIYVLLVYAEYAK